MNDHEILLTGRGALPFRFALPTRASKLGVALGYSESALEIPRVLHMVWIGGAIPERYAKNVADFVDHNPDWEVNLWVDDRSRPAMSGPAGHPGTFKFCPVGWMVDLMRNRDLYEQETNVAARVDLLRYEIIHQCGGVYLDADTLSLGPGSLERMTHAFLTVSGEPWCNTGNAQFGFAEGSEFLAYVIKHARDPRVRAQSCITRRTGPTFLTTCALSFNDFRIIHPNGAWLLEKVRHTADKNW